MKDDKWLGYMIISDSSNVWYACGGIYELKIGENCMSKKWMVYNLQIRKGAKNGQNRDLLSYISKCRDQGFMVFRIENDGNTELVLLITVLVLVSHFRVNH